MRVLLVLILQAKLKLLIVESPLGLFEGPNAGVGEQREISEPRSACCRWLLMSLCFKGRSRPQTEKF